MKNWRSRSVVLSVATMDKKRSSQEIMRRIWERLCSQCTQQNSATSAGTRLQQRRSKYSYSRDQQQGLSYMYFTGHDRNGDSSPWWGCRHRTAGSPAEVLTLFGHTTVCLLLLLSLWAVGCLMFNSCSRGCCSDGIFNGR